MVQSATLSSDARGSKYDGALARLHSNRDNQTTFGQIVAACRLTAAETLWNRACLASSLRHQTGTSKSARRALADLKQRCIQRAIELAPDIIRITVDDDFHVGLMSVRGPGNRRLHLPANYPA